MDDSLLVRLGLRLWPLHCFVLAHRPRRAVLVLALLLSLAPWSPPSRAPATAAFAARTLAVPAGSGLVGVAVDPGLGRAFLATSGSEVWAFDERSGQVLGATDVVAPGPYVLSSAIAVDDVGHRIYVATLAGSLTMLDGRTGVPDPPWTVKLTSGLALDSVAGRLLVSQAGEHALLAVDARSGQVVGAVALAEPAGLVAVDAPARRVYVAAADAARLDLLDADAYRPLATVALPDPADVLAVDSAARRVYAASASGGVVAVVDGRSGAVLATLQVGHGPSALAVDPATGHLFVADADANNVAVVDTRDNSVVATIAVAGSPTAMAVDPQTGLVFVVSHSAAGPGAPPDSGSVTVLRDRRDPPTLQAAIDAALLPRLGHIGAVAR